MDDKPEVRVNKDVLADVMKKYKKIKKYQKSNLFLIKKLDENK
tara:strand:- start:413 stop:541 length:129 start_codon:yes stop_codon:yes gene_type:complete